MVRGYIDKPIWVSYVLSHPFKVKRGDVIGVFYERFQMDTALLTILSRSIKNGSANTFIISKGLTELLGSTNTYVDKISDSNAKITINIDRTTEFRNRDPALVAIVEPDDLPMKLQKSYKEIQPPPVVTARPRSSSSLYQIGMFPKLLSRFSFNRVSFPLSSACAHVRSEIIGLSPNQHTYPFLESGLHIFEESQIRCGGYLTEWKFVVPRRHFAIYELYLAVFRSSVDKQSFTIVNFTHIEFMHLPQESSGQWFIVKIPSQNQFWVESGDYLGFYYKIFETPEDWLTILTTSIDVSYNFATWVFAFGNLTMPFDQVLNVKDSQKTHRRAALLANIKIDMDPAVTTFEKQEEAMKQNVFLNAYSLGQPKCQDFNTTATIVR